jgi:hypothetical protein
MGSRLGLSDRKQRGDATYRVWRTFRDTAQFGREPLVCW